MLPGFTLRVVALVAIAVAPSWAQNGEMDRFSRKARPMHSDGESFGCKLAWRGSLAAMVPSGSGSAAITRVMSTQAITWCILHRYPIRYRSWSTNFAAACAGCWRCPCCLPCYPPLVTEHAVPYLSCAVCKMAVGEAWRQATTMRANAPYNKVGEDDLIEMTMAVRLFYSAHLGCGI